MILCIIGSLLEYLLNALSGKTGLRHRAYTLHRWTARALRWLAVSFSTHGIAPASGLLVANHLSYLDILVFSAIRPCIFVSKREVRSWPGVGWVATLAGTIYIDRSRQHATHSVQPQMAAALAAGVPLVLFAEGTSSDGREVLPFRSSLFQPAVENRIPITAACISYAIENGDPSTDVCYYGDHVLGSHSMKLFGKNGIVATVQFGDRAKIFTDRKSAALELHEQVSVLKNQSAAAVSRVATALV